MNIFFVVLGIIFFANLIFSLVKLVKMRSLRKKMISRTLEIKELNLTTAVERLELWDCKDVQERGSTNVALYIYDTAPRKIWAFRVESRNRRGEQIWGEYASRGLKPLDPILLATFIADSVMKKFFITESEDSAVGTVWRDKSGTQSLKIYHNRFSAGSIYCLGVALSLSPETWYFGVDND